MNNNDTSSIVMSELKSGLKFEEVLKKEKDFLSERGADSNQLIGLAFSGATTTPATTIDRQFALRNHDKSSALARKNPSKKPGFLQQVFGANYPPD